jgi:2,4-dienoyl-CoA reductase-like NADH-dependent reductase (Old Yellow Enzyme family)
VNGSYTRLGEPLEVGPMRLRNRVVVAPMERNYANADGTLSPRSLAHYARIAAGGAGWIDVESTFVDPRGRGRTHQVGLHDDACVDGFRRLAEIAHAADVRIGVELHHAGRNTSPALALGTPVAPSPVECPEAGSGIPHELTLREIDEIVERYAAAAARAAAAGLDAVELHSAHGYLPLAFLSPLTNHRTDEYGGSSANRMRFALRVLAAIRAAVPEHVVVGCRFSAEEFLPGGLTLSDTIPYARALVAAGADYLSVSAGVYASFKWIIPPMDTPPGWLLPHAREIRSAVDVPVIGVSRITGPAAAEQALEDGSVDLVAFGRAFLTDPEWPRKVFEGRADEQVSCIGCNQGCVERIADQRDVTCLVNPICGRETELLARPAAEHRCILVLGGGPAGMEAARVAAERGHRVVLVERRAELGGQLRAARALPQRPGWEVFLAESGRRLTRAGVDVRLGTPLSRTLVDELRPDAVVLAVGSEYATDGVVGARPVDPLELLEHGIGEHRRALVLGDDATALGLGEWLATAGCETLVVGERAHFDEGPQTGLLDRLGALPGITLRSDRELRSASPKGVTIVQSRAIGPLFEEVFAPVDIVVDTTRRASLRRPEALAGVDASRIFPIGDCVAPRSALEAIEAGMRLALEL